MTEQTLQIRQTSPECKAFRLSFNARTVLLSIAPEMHEHMVQYNIEPVPIALR